MDLICLFWCVLHGLWTSSGQGLLMLFWELCPRPPAMITLGARRLYKYESKALSRVQSPETLNPKHYILVLPEPPGAMNFSTGVPRERVIELSSASMWEFPKIRGTLFWGPYNKDHTI